MNLLILSTAPGETEQARLLDAARSFGGGGDSIDAVHVPAADAPGGPDSGTALAAVAERFAGEPVPDAVLIAHFAEPALAELRRRWRPPALGMSEATFAQLGRPGTRVALFTRAQDGEQLALLRRLKEKMGEAGELVALHALPRRFDDAGGSLSARITELAQRAVSETRAEIIIVDGAAFPGIANAMRPQLQVPVLDSLECLVRIAASRVLTLPSTPQSRSLPDRAKSLARDAAAIWLALMSFGAKTLAAVIVLACVILAWVELRTDRIVINPIRNAEALAKSLNPDLAAHLVHNEVLRMQLAATTSSRRSAHGTSDALSVMKEVTVPGSTLSWGSIVNVLATADEHAGGLIAGRRVVLDGAVVEDSIGAGKAQCVRIIFSLAGPSWVKRLPKLPFRDETDCVESGRANAAINQVAERLLRAAEPFTLASYWRATSRSAEDRNAAPLEAARVLAEEIAARAPARSEDHWRALNMLGLVALDLNRWDTAITQFESASRASPNTPLILSNLAIAHLIAADHAEGADKTSHLQNGRAYADAALRLEGDYAPALFALALAEYESVKARKDSSAEPFRLLRKTVEYDPLHGPAHMNMGLLLESFRPMPREPFAGACHGTQCRDLAIESYRRAIAADPALLRARKQLGRLLIERFEISCYAPDLHDALSAAEPAIKADERFGTDIAIRRDRASMKCPPVGGSQPRQATSPPAAAGGN